METASADEEGAGKYVDSLDELITDDGYPAVQIFNVKKELHWKRMPEHISIKKPKACLDLKHLNIGILCCLAGKS